MEHRTHRTQITLTDDQYQRLRHESARSGLSLAELVRRALDQSIPAAEPDDALRAVDASFATWDAREFDGASYVEGLRRGLGRRIAG